MAEVSGVLTAGRRQASDAQTDRVSGTKTKFQEAAENSRTAKVATGLGLATTVALGVAMKDGIDEGFKKIGGIGKIISSIFAIPATLLIPFTTAYGEYEGLRIKNPTEQSSSKLLEIVYPILSIAFAPMTAFEPLEKATQSKGHMITTLLNMPHIAFTFFTYTGGRALTLWKSLQLAFCKLSDEERLRLGNEAKLASTLGDIGSDNAAVAPQAHQAATGWAVLGNILTGDFASVKEKLSEAPVTTILGTFIGSVFWIPTFIGKSFDTVIRTLEMTDQLKNTLPENSLMFKKAVDAKEWWHNTSASKSMLGKILSSGREFGKIMQAVASPVGMISVVFPVFDHFIHGFNNKEAEEAGGIIKGFDKVLGIGAFLGHCYFTTLYGLFIRLPQTVVTTTFYGCNIINRMRGVLDNPNDPRYIDPREIRDRLFNPNKGWAKWISNISGNVIEKCTGKRFLYDNIYKVIADQECFRPIREQLYKDIFKGTRFEIIDKSTGKKKLITKEVNKDPLPIIWNEILEYNKPSILAEARERFKKYLKEASLFNEERINGFFSTHKVYDKIEAELEKLIDGELKACLGNNAQSSSTIENENSKFKKPRIESESFFDMLKHPIQYKNDIKEIFKFRTAIAQLIMSPLNVLDFVNIVEMGDKESPYWLTNWLVQESSIRIGDYKAGNTGELMTVYCHAMQTAGKGAAHIKQAAEKLLRLAA